MAITSWTLVRVYGTWVDAKGDMLPGTYKISVPARLTNSTADIIIPAGVYDSGALNTTPGVPSLSVLCPATDDPDIQQDGWKLIVEITLTGGRASEKYTIDVPVADRPVEDGGNGLGVNLRTIMLAANAPSQLAQYGVGRPNGLALLSEDGTAVLDADGNPIEATADWEGLTGKPSVIAAGADAGAARSAIGAASAEAVASKADLDSGTGKLAASQLPTVPAERIDATPAVESLLTAADAAGARAGISAVGKGELVVNVRDFGAVGNGSADDTAAFRAAIAATPTGGTLLIPPTGSYYRVTQQAENYLFLITRAMTVRGDGPRSTIGVDSAVTSTTDIFQVAPTVTDGVTRGIVLDNFSVTGISGATPGRHAVHIDLTTTGTALSNSAFTRLHLGPLGGYSIFLTNPTSTTGFYGSRIQQNLIWGGIKLQRGGDSLTVAENVIAGYRNVDVTLIPGSNTFVFAFNNVTCRGGVRIGSGHNMKILSNNLEAAYSDSTGSNGAILDIDGSDIVDSWGLLATEVRGNNFTFRPAVPDATVNAIRVNKARSVVIETNHIAHKASNHIVITSAATETIIGYNLFSSVDPYGIIVDGGARTIRKDTLRLSPSGAREIYEAEAAILRYRAAELIQHIDKLTYKPIALNNAPALNFEWNVANTFTSKYVWQTQKRNADNSVDAAKVFARVADGYLYFSDGGLAITDSAGVRWRVTVTTGGVLTTTAI